MTEDHLIRYCAPTLAGIKTANLFTCSCHCIEELRNTVRGFNRRLAPKGLRLLPLRYSGGKALIYVYRPYCLKQDLSDGKACCILKKHGYCMKSCEACIAQLIQQKTCGFPQVFFGPFIDTPYRFENQHSGFCAFS